MNNEHTKRLLGHGYTRMDTDNLMFSICVHPRPSVADNSVLIA